MVESQGIVNKILGGGWHRVTLETGQVIQAKLSGRLRQHRIRVIEGDDVKIELSEADLSKGFITYRLS